jgi:hypothetical protein
MAENYDIKTEEDFHQVLGSIDEEMRAANVPIPARQVKGWVKFSSRYGLRLKMSDRWVATNENRQAECLRTGVSGA